MQAPRPAPRLRPRVPCSRRPRPRTPRRGQAHTSSSHPARLLQQGTPRRIPQTRDRAKRPPLRCHRRHPSCALQPNTPEFRHASGTSPGPTETPFPRTTRRPRQASLPKPLTAALCRSQPLTAAHEPPTSRSQPPTAAHCRSYTAHCRSKAAPSHSQPIPAAPSRSQPLPAAPSRLQLLPAAPSRSQPHAAAPS